MAWRRVAAVIPSAGAGVRMGADRPKQYLEVGGRPVIALTLGVFQGYPRVDEVILVAPPEDVPYVRTEIVERFEFNKVSRIVAGGATRQDSVRLGLNAVEGEPELVMIHDGVRPFVDHRLLDRLLEAAVAYRGVVPGLAPDETVKRVDPQGEVCETIDRSILRVVQTPQVFRFADIRQAHRRALDEGWDGVTDDAMLLERAGLGVKVVEGSRMNVKVTSPIDLAWARFLMSGTGWTSRSGWMPEDSPLEK